MKLRSYLSSFGMGPGREGDAGLPPEWRELLGAQPFLGDAGFFSLRIFWRRTTPFTAVVGFEVCGGRLDGRRYWLKVYRREPEAAGRESAFLRNVMERLGAGGGPGVVQVVALLPEIGGIVTAHIEGPQLSLLLEARDAGHDRRMTLCRDAGVLLARIHGAAAPTTAERFDFAPVLDAIQREAREFPGEIRRRLNGRLEALAGQISPGECALRPGHGDYGAYNLIAAAGGPVAFDPSFHREFPRPGTWSTPAEDLAKFAVWLRGIRPRRFAAPERRCLQAAFFSGYREAGGAVLGSESPSVRVLFTYCLLRGLRDWGGLGMRLAGGPPQARVFPLWLDELAGGIPALP